MLSGSASAIIITETLNRFVRRQMIRAASIALVVGAVLGGAVGYAVGYIARGVCR